MNFDVFEAIHSMALILDEYFKGSPFVFKSSDKTQVFEPALPMIYEFCIPPCDRNSVGYPIRCPAIAIVVDEIQTAGRDRIAKIGLHAAVCNPCVSEAEMAQKSEFGGYTLKDSDRYFQDGAYSDLYAAALRLGEECLFSIESNVDSLRVNSLALTPPDVELIDFPFAASVVTCDLMYSRNARANCQDISKYL